MQYVWRLYVAPTADTVLSAVYSTGFFLSSLTSYIYPARLTLEESIEQLLSVRESVRTREHQLREDITQHERRARECVETTLIREARMSIKFKLIYEAQLDRVQRTLTALETHLLTLQNAVLNRQVFTVLRCGNRALSPIDEDMAENVVEDLHDLQERTNDILQLLSVSDAVEADDDTVESELRRMQSSDSEGVVIVSESPQVFLPPVPTTTLPSVIPPSTAVIEQ
tara:strand:+ start:2147 stop:2824 length:678 start_codon:yes stop_codon:yes gene_type:complete